MKKLLLLFAVAITLQTQAQNGVNEPAGDQCWKQLDAGGFFIIGLKEDGTLWGWGKNFGGALGTAPETVTVPVQIGTDNDWKTVSAGNGHVMALKNNGTLWAWGRNDAGQLGKGMIGGDANDEPAQIGTYHDWIYISAGGIHSHAIRANGSLWGWGYNTSGQLGNGQVDPIGPVQVTVPTQIGIDKDWKIVDDSSHNTAAIKTDGTVWITGEGNSGTIGNGAFNDVSVFTQAGTDTDWVSISLGGFAASAIKTDGTLWGWGFNFSGGVGNGANEDVSSPVQIGTDDTWKSVVRGMNYFAGAIKEDGTLWTWGYNYYGSLGDGTTGNKNSPVQIASDLDWKSYYGAGDYSVALKEDGSLMVWGYNYFGQLGFNLEGDTVLNPIQVETCNATAGLNDNILTSILLYPNPTSATLTLANAENLTIEQLQVIDVAGKTLMTQKGNNTQIDVQQLPAGMYFLNVSAKGSVQHLKFIKE